MAKQTLQIPMPLKGVNRTYSRSQQPDGTVWDALNVLPFDRYGRQRIAQRSGTSKLWATALASGSSIDLLHQVTIALDPARIVADTLLLDETFTYTDGELDSVTAGVWVTHLCTSGQGLPFIGITGSTTAGAMDVVSNAVVESIGGTNSGVWARYTTGLSPGTAYIVQIEYTNTSTSGAVGLTARFDPSNGTINLKGVNATLSFSTTNATFRLRAGTTSLAPDVVVPMSAVETTSTPRTFSLQVNGDAFIVLVDGVPYQSATTSLGAGTVGVGFGIANTSSGGSPATVDNFKVYTGESLATYRQTDIVAVAGGDIFIGDIDNQAEVVAGGTNQLSGGVRAQAASAYGYTYLVDGYNIVKVNVVSRLVETFAESAGTAPDYCTLAAMYRGRLVLAAPRDNPQNFFMSRVGDPLDWDYSQTDAAAAFAGNASESGAIGEPIVALIPFGSDRLLIGGDHNLWMINGDPADGGSIDLVSDAIGLLGPNAWTKSPDGTVYFIGTGGLFRMTPGSSNPEPISINSYNQFFAGLDRGSNYIQMVWDRDNVGAFIFVTPSVSGTATHLFYDARNGGFWPLQFPNTFGPISAIVYDGDASADRVLLLGARNGYVQQLLSTELADDTSTVVPAHVILGPYRPFTETSIMTGVTLDFGELATADAGSPNTWTCTVTLRGGDTAYDVTEGTPTAKAAIVTTRDRRQKTFRQRIRGGWFAIKLENPSIQSEYFTFDGGTMEFEQGGRNRGQR